MSTSGLQEKRAIAPRRKHEKLTIRAGRFLRKDLLSWGLLLPGLVLFAFFIWEPMLNGIRLSFYATQGFSTTAFVGIDNYLTLIKDSTFHTALANSFSYVFWSILIGFLVPIVLAIILNEVTHARGFIRTALYFPNMVPSVAALLLWGFMMDPGQGGLFNALRGLMGLAPFGWLQASNVTIPLIILMATWKSAGATSLIYMASLQGISPELYEAAALDGAGVGQKIRYITLPGLYNLGRLMLIMQIIFIFQILQEPLVTTGGGPNNASISLMLMNFNFAFRDFKIGMAASVGVLVSLILMALSLVYFKVSRENEMN